MRATLSTGIFVSLLAAASAAAPRTATAQPQASVTLSSTVSGNREQPRVMYIVPWQQPQAAQFDYELDNTIAEELFTPVDRDEFVRELTFRHALEQRQAAQTDNDQQH